MKTLGVIGGLGPQATAYFLELLTKMTAAVTDQQHIPTIVISNPGIPDRTEYILGRSSANPFPAIIEIGRKLAAMQADCIAIPCMTAHYFHQKLIEAIPVPVMNAIDATSEYLYQEGICSVGVMATDGTIASGLFQQAFQSKGIQVVLPEEADQKVVMDIIYQEIKAGREIHVERFRAAVEHVRKQGAQVVVLGCTELSLLKRDYELQGGYLDVMEVLAKTAVQQCGSLKRQFHHLI